MVNQATLADGGVVVDLEDGDGRNEGIHMLTFEVQVALEVGKLEVGSRFATGIGHIPSPDVVSTIGETIVGGWKLEVGGMGETIVGGWKLEVGSIGAATSDEML